ncbi:MAG: hypothetical protein IMZ53_08375 [Thermoplasmata archaeon]|nr:hypothetical protein [Thermoplasmata archaeon]MBE3140584.1 hypothetical protein [Thermoplasmata archaeon]
MAERLQKRTKMLFILILGIMSGVFLVLTADNPSWIADEIFAIMLSIIFFSPLIYTFFNLHIPKDYIIFFIVGLMLFIIYVCIYRLSFDGAFSLLLKVILFSSVSTLGKWVVYALAKTTPPQT